MSTSIDLERNYEVPEVGKKPKEKKGEKIKFEEDEEYKSLAGLSGTRW